MPNDLEAPDCRPGIEVLEHPVSTIALGERGDPSLRIVQIAKHNRIRGADLLARGLDDSVGDGLPQATGLDSRLLDALHAERALLHHTTRTNGHVRIEDKILESILMRVVKPIELPHLVRAVIGAVPRTDTAVVPVLCYLRRRRSIGQAAARPGVRSADTSSADEPPQVRRRCRSNNDRSGSSASHASGALRPDRQRARCSPPDTRSRMPNNRCRY